jgi:hypothetical protein
MAVGKKLGVKNFHLLDLRAFLAMLFHSTWEMALFYRARPKICSQHYSQHTKVNLGSQGENGEVKFIRNLRGFM